MSIKSGTLRRKFEKAISEKVLCKNGLLICLASMESSRAYSDEDKQAVAKILVDNGCTADELKRVIPQITPDYHPTSDQITRLLGVISAAYTYDARFIDDSLLRSVNQTASVPPQTKKNAQKRIDTSAIKKYIYENGEVETILKAIGCENIKYHSGKNYWSCSNYDGDNETAVNIKDGPYLGVKNWTRAKDFNDKADIITLVQYNQQCPFREAIDFICDVLGLPTNDLPTASYRKNTYRSDNDKKSVNTMPDGSVDELKFLDEKELLRYSPTLYIGWFREGIMSWTRKKFGLAYCHETKRVIIPMRHWQTGKLLGINTRTTVEHAEELGIPKYKLTPSYPKGKNLYGLYENYNAIQEAGKVVVYEAEKSVLKRDSVNDPTGVALSGKSLSDTQAEILLGLDVDIIISMDADVGIEEVLHICEKLYQKNDKKIYYTIDNHGLMGAKDSIADLGKEAFTTILSEMVLYDKREHERYLEFLGKR